jgi:hypothetical protein
MGRVDNMSGERRVATTRKERMTHFEEQQAKMGVEDDDGRRRIADTGGYDG